MRRTKGTRGHAIFLSVFDQLDVPHSAQEKKVSCQSVVCEGALCSVDEFLIEYDQLLIAVGQLLPAPTDSQAVPRHATGTGCQ